MEFGRLIGPELRELLIQDPDALKDLAGDLHPQDVSEILGELDPADVAHSLSSLPLEFAAQVFERLSEDMQVDIAQVLGVNSTVQLVTEMSADETVDFFGLLPEETVANLLIRLEAIDPDHAEDVRDLTHWHDESAGGLMNNEFVDVTVSATVEEAIAALRAKAKEGYEVLDIVFVLDNLEQVVGFVTLRGLLLGVPSAPISEIMHQNMVSVTPDIDQEEVARVFAKYDLNALPVLDENRHMLGIITADDIMDVIEDEAGEDAHKMAAMGPLENSYFDVPFLTYLSKRAPWLLVLFVGGFFSTSVMENFAPVLQSLTQLAFYIPLLISAGGNSGSQSATLIIRGLTTGEIEKKDWWRVMVRELVQGLCIGSALAICGVARVLWAGDGPEMAALISLTIISLVAMGCVVGSMMPLLMERLGVDPATSSTPFIATLIDALGILIYLSMARWLLQSANGSMLPNLG